MKGAVCATDSIRQITDLVAIIQLSNLVEDNILAYLEHLTT